MAKRKSNRDKSVQTKLSTSNDNGRVQVIIYGDMKCKNIWYQANKYM